MGTSLNYRVSSVDSCGIPSPMSPLHNTIYPFPYYNECQASIRITWNEYQKWNDGISKYKIYYRVGNGAFSFLAQVSGNTLEYLHENVLFGENYCYYIRAYNGNNTKTSTSNMTCITTNISNVPSVINADYASVEGYNEVQLSFTVDTTIEIKSYKILRALGDTIKFDTIATIRQNISPILYSDYAEINNTSATYKLAVISKCNKVITESNLATTMLLKVVNTGDLKHTLHWSHYGSWLGGIDHYNIYRIIDDGAPQLISSEISGTTYFYDDVSNIERANVKGGFCYYVEAVEADNNPYEIHGKSRSNISCAEQFPRVFIPSAFTPDNNSINDVLIPYVTFADPQDYTFTIYNRWGENVFETHNYMEGWDGKSGNKMPIEGVYAYYLTFTSAENKFFKQSGTITIFFP
jgi:gliding motility-associated-like protein